MLLAAIALTDHDAVYGAVRFVQAAKTCGIRPILGSELTLQGDHHLTLLVENQTGWHNLCYLISRARHNAPKGQAALPPSEVDGHTEGLIALSGCRAGEIASALLQGDWRTATRAARRYRDLFGVDRFFIELQNHRRSDDEALLYKLITLSRRLGIDYVATNNVHYTLREGHALQDVLVCIRQGITLDESTSARRANSEYYLKSGAEMAALFADTPDAIANTQRIAERCRFDLRYGLQDLPSFPTPPGMTAETYLQSLCETALARRYAGSPAAVQERLHYELGVIARSDLCNYFLIVWDIVRYARDNDVRCQGRGSAANSLVAYLLDISPIDPIVHGLVFERFLSDERKVAPDIDIDFEAGDAREKVIQYVYERYGTDHAAMASTLVTFRARSALREIGKALGFPLDLLGQAAKVLDTRDPKAVCRSPALQEFLGSHAASLPWQQLLRLCGQIAGFPRHLGIHNGGMIIMGSPLAQRVPTEPATMPGRVVIQWDKEALEDVGLIKIDILGLRMLSAIADALREIEATTGERIDLDALPFDDPAVYDMICQADTIGMFQVESRAQAQVLPRMRPRKFEDLIVSISLIRPGPIVGQMVHPYLRRRLGKEAVTYYHPLLKPSLEETLGVILFQEQVLKVARDLGNFTPGQGEQLRRALGAKAQDGKIERFQAAFLDGARVRGVARTTAEVVFEKLKGFGSYSFPKSHAAAFAVLVYQSAWLKRYHPAAFFVGLLNNQPMGFWQPAVLVNDARRHGVGVMPIDVNASRGRCSLEGGNIRLGLNYVEGIGSTQADAIVAARGDVPFTNLTDFCRRTRLARNLVENLILVGAMDRWGIARRNLLWQLGTLHYGEDELPLVFPEETIELPPLSRAEQSEVEYGVMGLSTGEHVMALHREWLTAQGILDSRALESCTQGQQVKVAGLIVIHQAPPTAKGFRFITLEDEAGMMNVIIRPDIYPTLRRVLRESALLIFEGRVQRQEGVVNVVAQQAAPLLATRSSDSHTDLL